MVRIGRRIAVIGCPGSGKSVLSMKLGKMTGLPVYHLDKIFWKPGWTESDHDDFMKKLQDIVNRDSWIIDGNYGNTLKMRLDHADTVIYLDFRRLLRTYRILKRIVRWHGKTRVDMADGCPEEFDRDFLRFVWNYDLTERPKTLKIISESKIRDSIVVLKSPASLRKFLKTHF